MDEEEFGAESGGGGAGSTGRLLVDGRYLIERGQRIGELGGCPAFMARDTLAPHELVVALAPSTLLPARAELPRFARLRLDGMLQIRAMDQKSGATWLICDAPPASLVKLSGWTEHLLLERVARPIAATLHALEQAGLTHRAIRPDNVFEPGSRLPVRLGPCAAAPPGFHQPSIFEPLSSAICPAGGRGNGSIADDVFSLGVLLATLLGGSVPQSDRPSAEVLAQRFARGSFEVIAGHLTLSPIVASLLAAMLADDPALRPSPHDLLNVSDRKNFSARQAPVARVPVRLGNALAHSPRELAWQAASAPMEFASLLRRGVIEQWMKRELGLVRNALQIAHFTREMAVPEGVSLSPSQLMEAQLLLAPDLPLFWHGVWFWPDALGTLISGAAGPGSPVRQDFMLDALKDGAIASFLHLAGGKDIAEPFHKLHRTLSRITVVTPGNLGVYLPYLANPFQPCLSPRFTNERLATPHALLAQFDMQTADAPRKQEALLDRQMVAFLICSAFRDGEMSSFTEETTASHLSDLRILARFQALLKFGPLPGIARQILPDLAGALKQWRSKAERERRKTDLDKAARNGDLGQMLILVSDPLSLAHDRRGMERANREVRMLELDQSAAEGLEPVISPRQRQELVQIVMALGAIALLVSLCTDILA